MISIKGKIFLAPMASVADYPFRLICVQNGAECVCSELVSAKALTYGDEKSFKIAAVRPDEGPAGIQLFTSEPDIMAKAARIVADFECKPAFIDLNAGCPVKKVFSNGQGSALLRDKKKVFDLIYAAKNAVPEIPISIKMRLGIEDGELLAPEIAKAARDAGADFITVHGRTRSMFYSGKADLDGIARVVDAVDIPVIGNGDIKDGESADEMYRRTGCAAIAVGRAALGKPWIFNLLKAHRDKKEFTPPTGEQTVQIIKNHLNAVCSLYGERGIIFARTHLIYYSKGKKGSAEFRRRISEITTKEEAFAAAEKLFAPECE